MSDLCVFLLISNAKSPHKVNDTKMEWLFQYSSILRNKRGRQPTLYKTVHIIFIWNKLKWDIRFSKKPKNFSHHEYNIIDGQYWHKFHNLEYSEFLYQIKRHFLTTWSTSTQVLATWLSNDRMHSYPRALPRPFVFVFLDQMKHSFHVPECCHLALLCYHTHNAHLFLQSQLLPHKEQALSPSIVTINQVDCHHFWIIINCYLLLLLTWVLLNHSHEEHYIRQMLNFFLGHNIHVPIHGLCNQLFLYSQSNQAECCHLVTLFSASTKLWKASPCLFICLSVRPSVCPHTTQLLLERFSWNLTYECFSKACQENPSYVEIW